MRDTTLLSRYRSIHAAALIVFALTAPLVNALADPVEPDGQPSAPIAPLSPELQAALREIFNYDPLNTQAKRPTSLLRKSTSNDLDWNRTEKSDGSSAVSVKKPLPTPWDAKVGADFGLTAPLATSFQPDKDPSKDNGTGAAWATLTVPGVASVDARVDPLKEQRKLGTTVSRSVPIGSNYTVTLLNSFAVTETPGGAAAPSPAQVWSTDRLVKLNLLSTGTSLAAGTTSSTVDNITHNKFSAEQKLFQNFNVTTAVTDLGTNRPANKSITAGFKLKW